MLKNGATLMSALTVANRTRPQWDSELTSNDKLILMNVTNETIFAVYHQHCGYELSHKVRQIDNHGNILLFGNVGHSKLPHGVWVDLQDLLQYTRQIAAQHTQLL